MLNVILETYAGTLTQGLIYAILSYGIFITYKILDFPDLTVDGSFPLGAAVTAVLLTRGVNAWLTLPVAMLIGAAAGLCTGLIHVRARVRDLLAGIITMTALYSVNLQIAGSNLMVERAIDTIYTSAPVMALLGGVPLLTALSVYDDIAKHAGAGTLVPITGFANAVVSPAIEFKAEGFVTGMAAKMFIIAGPVIVYGTVASVLYGLILVIFGG